MHSPRPLLRVLLLLLVAACCLETRRAHADEVAPELEGADLRVRAQSELKRLVATLSETDRRRLAGTYVAFDGNAADPIAQIACDDDGDHVVLVSDGMLRLIANVARAASLEGPSAPRKIEAYAAFVARVQIPGRRLLPPSAGFFGPEPSDAYEERLVEALAFVIADELERLRAGDLACPSPTATRESGDDVWTPRETQAALAIARATYPGRQLERETAAVARVREAGRTEKGAMAVARFFAALEAERVDGSARFVPSYVRTHPDGAARHAVVERAARGGPLGARAQ